MDKSVKSKMASQSVVHCEKANNFCPKEGIDMSDSMNSVESDENPQEFSVPVRRFYCFLFCMNYFFIGIGNSIIGPNLKALTVMMNTTDSFMSILLSSKYLIYGLSSLLTSISYKKFNRHYQFLLALTVCAFVAGVVPLCHNFNTFAPIFAIKSFYLAIIDSCSILAILQMYSRKSRTQMQLLYFSISLGNAIGPLLAGLFLPSLQMINAWSQWHEKKDLIKQSNNTVSQQILNELPIKPQNPYAKVYISFTIASCLTFFGIICLVIFQFIKPFKPISRKMEAKDNSSKKSPPTPDEITLPNGPNLLNVKLPNAYFVAVILFAALQLGAIVVMESVVSLYLTSFLINGPARLAQNTASYVLSVQMLSFSGSRLINLFLSKRVNHLLLISFHFLLLIFGYTGFYLLNEQTASYAWVIAPMVGYGFSTLYPLTITFLETRINVTANIQMIIQISFTLFNTSAPLVVGNFIESKPMVFVYTTAFFLVFAIFQFICLQITDIWKKSFLKSAQDQRHLVTS